MNSIFLDTLNGRPVKRPPVWFMRQAGRVLPNYNKLKEQYAFSELMVDAALAATVTLMPVDDLGVDAAILFSDILVIPNALGLEPEFTDKGPVFHNPLGNNRRSSDRLTPDTSKLEYIYKAIDEIVRRRPANTPLIGFCGAPLTTLCYMIQGLSGDQGFPDAIRFLYLHKKEAGKLIDAVTEMAAHYAVKQIEHGIDAFQLFETHAGLVPLDMYMELFMPAVKKISTAVRQTGTPFIFFPKGIGTGLRYITPDIADVAGVDWQIPLQHAREIIHPGVGLQGNLDPRALYGSLSSIEKELERYLPLFATSGKWIFNLGHGFMPDTPYENAKFVVDWIKKAPWEKYL